MKCLFEDNLPCPRKEYHFLWIASYILQEQHSPLGVGVKKSTLNQVLDKAVGSLNDHTLISRKVHSRRHSPISLRKDRHHLALTRENVCEQHRRRPAAHPRSLISTFYISLIGKYHINTCYNRSLSEQAGLNLILSESPKTGFVTSWPSHGTCFKVHFRID